MTGPEPSHAETVDRVQRSQRFAVNVPGLGPVAIPRPEQVAFYGVLGALVAFELVEWPIALAVAAGHAIVSERQAGSGGDQRGSAG